MKDFKYSVSFMLILAVALVFIGCAKPPEAEKAAAKGAMDASMTAGADKYAAVETDAAKKVWDSAEAQMKEKKYKEAKQGYVDAKAAFDKATAAVEAGKKAVAAEVSAAAGSLEEAWKNLEAAGKSQEKKMKQDMKDAWAADTKAFTDGLKATKDAIAVDAAGAKAKVGGLKAIIEKWNASFKELAAIPDKPEPAPKKAKKGKK
jgi:hypothetical protein